MQIATTFIIQLAVEFLQLLDWLANFPQKLIYAAAKGVIVASVLFFVFVPILKTISTSNTPLRRDFTNGLVYNLYGLPQNNNPNLLSVLGAADVAENVPALVNKIAFPEITSRSVLVLDLTTDKPLYKYNSAVRMAPASTTKLMTALVALDLYKLDEVVTVPTLCTLIDSELAGFKPGDKIVLKDMLYALLVKSAGDAACTLASDKVSYGDFVSLMNKKAQQIGMVNTQFTNPIGLDAAESAHYSTAEDLAKLASAAVKNDLLRQIVATREYDVPIQEQKTAIHVANTNQLLWDVPNSVGIKTGTTQAAGEVLIYQYKDDLKNLMIIVMGSQDRFYDTQAVLKWVFDSYSW